MLTSRKMMTAIGMTLTLIGLLALASQIQRHEKWIVVGSDEAAALVGGQTTNYCCGITTACSLPQPNPPCANIKNDGACILGFEYSNPANVNCSACVVTANGQLCLVTAYTLEIGQAVPQCLIQTGCFWNYMTNSCSATGGVTNEADSPGNGCGDTCA